MSDLADYLEEGEKVKGNTLSFACEVELLKAAVGFHPMDRTWKSIWTEALRGGYYKQGQDKLHRRSTNTYCCLGVIAELADMKTAPRQAMLSEEDLNKLDLEPGVANRLAFLNDNGWTFSEIANLIEVAL